MKTLNRLKLSQLNEAELEQRQMNALRGGYNCGCGCDGPSGTRDNYNANVRGGYTESYGGNVACGSIIDHATEQTH